MGRGGHDARPSPSCAPVSNSHAIRDQSRNTGCESSWSGRHLSGTPDPRQTCLDLSNEQSTGALLAPAAEALGRRPTTTATWGSSELRNALHDDLHDSLD